MSEGGEETYSASETARLLRVTSHRVRQMLNSGELEGERDGLGHWRVPKRAVHVLLEERPRRDRGRAGSGADGGEESASYEAPSEGGPVGERLQELEEKLERAHRDIGRLEGARELEETARSTLQAQLDRERGMADRERERAERLEEELRQANALARRPWWKRMFRRSSEG